MGPFDHRLGKASVRRVLVDRIAGRLEMYRTHGGWPLGWLKEIDFRPPRLSNEGSRRSADEHGSWEPS
ncbi:MAG: hypothetical protein OXC93_08565, partial [Rhodospirillaceae bacterium]|nr:hypothetical protein [Rhodospirillaceae bacterium]